METQPYRQRLMVRMTDIAERLVANEGLSAVQARRVAQEADCSVGTLYNIFGGLDGLIIAVNRRSLSALGQKLDTVARSGSGQGIPDRLLALALAYRDFAMDETQRWRAMFEHRMESGGSIPADYREEQDVLFGLVEQVIAHAIADTTHLKSAARALFSGVHGILALALDNKLGAQSADETERQIRFLVGAVSRGLAASAAGIKPAG